VGHGNVILTKTVALVEAKEMALKAWNGATVSGTAGLSNYRRGQKPTNTSVDTPVDALPLREKLAMKGKCSTCNKEIAVYRRFPSGKINKLPFKQCPVCYRVSQKSSSSSISTQESPIDSASAVSGFFIGAVEPDHAQPNQNPLPGQVGQSGTDRADTSDLNSVVLNHQIFKQEGWRAANTLSHPIVRLRISTSECDYRKFDVPFPSIQPKHVDVVTDSGAQSCLWSRDAFVRSGFHLRDLIPVRHSMKAANTAPIHIDGAILLRLSGLTKNGDEVEAAVMVYISPDAKDFFLSKEAMIQLGIIGADFPQLGVASAISGNCQSIGNTIIDQQHPCEQPEQPISLKAECGCLKRQLPPPTPDSLPFPCVPENRAKMKHWLLERFSMSTFNNCPHQILPTEHQHHSTTLAGNCKEGSIA